MATTQAIVEGLSLMAAELKSPPVVNSEKVARWAVVFADWSDQVFGMACVKAISTLTWFPTPAEFRQLAEGTPEDRSVAAWDKVRQAIQDHGSMASFDAGDLGGDRAALWAMERCGIEELGGMTPENRTFKAAEFRRLYHLACETGQSLNRIQGKFERTNQCLGIDVAHHPALVGRSRPMQYAIEQQLQRALTSAEEDEQ